LKKNKPWYDDYPHKPQEAPEPINYRRVTVDAFLQAIKHDPLKNLLNIPVQIANKVGFQIKKIVRPRMLKIIRSKETSCIAVIAGFK
jgi:hypothetical protein